MYTGGWSVVIGAPSVARYKTLKCRRDSDEVDRLIVSDMGGAASVATACNLPPRSMRVNETVIKQNELQSI